MRIALFMLGACVASPDIAIGVAGQSNAVRLDLAVLEEEAAAPAWRVAANSTSLRGRWADGGDLRESAMIEVETTTDLVWIQGEADALDDEFGAMTAGLFAAFRKVRPGLRIWVVPLREDCRKPGADSARSAQVAIADSDPRTFAVFGDLVEGFDGLHYTEPDGVAELAELIGGAIRDQ